MYFPANVYSKLYRHLQIERAYVDICPFKKVYQREYLWNHTYHIPKYEVDWVKIRYLQFLKRAYINMGLFQKTELLLI